jgi:hypothetical protein
MTTQDALKELALHARNRAYYFERRASEKGPDEREPKNQIAAARENRDREAARENARAFTKASEMISSLVSLREA